MPLIRNIRERRKKFLGEIRRQAGLTERTDGIIFRSSDFDGIDKVLFAYVNEEMLDRVHRRIANDFVAGKTEWPERTTLSRKSFRGNSIGLVNVVDYAPYVEHMHENNRDRGYKVPTSFPSMPARRYVTRVWATYAQRDIARTRRLRSG